VIGNAMRLLGKPKWLRAPKQDAHPATAEPQAAT
jgi:hypothetical protein